MGLAQPWWRSAVVYQIYPRSFLDTDGDGVGDLEGVRRRLDHLAWLGVDAIWLSPIYPSPMADCGYDVADYCDIDPVFGDLAGFDRLVHEAHERGIRVLLDWVANHTSDRHPWFQASRSSRDDPKRDWYIWRDQPNNWTAAFGTGSAWTLDEATGQHYLHLFLPQQPDLNWANPEVVDAMHGVLRFWLDRGVDGFRADVIHLIGKDPALPDDPPELVGTSRVGFHDLALTHELLRGIRDVLGGYDGDRMMVGEVNLADADRIARYYGAADELHLVFNFGLLFAPWDARAWRSIIAGVLEAYGPSQAWPTWVLNNHDQVRAHTRYGSEARARAAALALLTLPGTPFLYAGEELGLEQAVVPPERTVDPGGRDGTRAPLPWTEGSGSRRRDRDDIAGLTTAPARLTPDYAGTTAARARDATDRHGWAGEPWLPWPPDPAERSIERQRDDEGSILYLYHRLLAARRASPALTGGELTFLDAPDGVLAYTRASEGDRRAVLVNFTDAEQRVTMDGDVELSSDGAPVRPGLLGPAQAVLLRW